MARFPVKLVALDLEDLEEATADAKLLRFITSFRIKQHLLLIACPGTIMAKYKLVPVSGLAKAFKGPLGNGELSLHPNTKLGRSTSKADGYRFPVDWGQISGQHCRVYTKATDVSEHACFCASCV